MAPSKILSVTVVLFFVGLTAWRMQYGVDFSDESYYSAQTYRFLLGDRPFVDDHLILSSMAFVTLPFLKLFYTVVGSLKGVILYFRFIHLALSLITAFSVWTALRGREKGPVVLLTALIPVVYLHHQMPTLSYNSMALHFWTIGVFLSLGSILSGRIHLVHCILSALALSLMSVVYPPLALAALVQFAIVLNATRPNSQTLVKILSVPLAILILFSIWIHFEWSQIGNVIAASQESGGAGGFKKIKTCIVELWTFTPYNFFLIPISLSFNWLRRLPSWLNAAILLMGIFMPAVLSRATGHTSGFAMHVLGYVYYWVLFGPFLYLLVKADSERRQLFLALYPVSVFAGFVTAWASSYRVSSLGFVVGFFPAFIICALLYALNCPRLTRRQIPLNTPAIAITLILILLAYYQRLPFKDEPISFLDTRIEGGPFHLLKTSRTRAKDESLMRAGISRFNTDTKTTTSTGKIFVFESMPSLYLYSTLRPAATTLYKACVEGRTVCRDHYSGLYDPNNLVVHIKPYRYNLDVLSLVENTLTPDDPLIAYVKGHHHVVTDSVFYTLYTGG